MNDIVLNWKVGDTLLAGLGRCLTREGVVLMNSCGLSLTNELKDVT